MNNNFILMDQSPQQNLFDVKLNDPGKLYIRKFAVAARILILIGVLISLIFITGTIIRTVKVDPSIFANNKPLRLQHRIFPFYTVVYSILVFLQLYFYWKVSRCLSRGVNYNNELMFNESFAALYRNALFGIATLFLALLMNAFDLYLAAKYYLN